MKLLLIVDGGTTNLRVTALDAETKEILAKASAAGGVKHTAVDGDNHRLKELLKDCILKVLDQTGCTYDDVSRCIAFGMITSGMGLYEIAHCVAPVSGQILRDGMKTKVFPEIAPFAIEFIPGVRNFSGDVNEANCSGMDMMRGEEVEAVGLYDLLGLHERAIFVLPGSHNKFVSMDEEGRILGCMTSISGEMLDAITHNTILAGAVAGSFCSAETYDPVFAVSGARECAASGLGRAAFAGRILGTLGDMPAEKVQSWLLGAVLMEDIRAMQTFAGGTGEIAVYIAGKPPLQQAFYDVLTAVGNIRANCVAPEISSGMGIRGAMRIASGN